MSATPGSGAARPASFGTSVESDNVAAHLSRSGAVLLQLSSRFGLSQWVNLSPIHAAALGRELLLMAGALGAS